MSNDDNLLIMCLLSMIYKAQLAQIEILNRLCEAKLPVARPAYLVARPPDFVFQPRKEEHR